VLLLNVCLLSFISLSTQSGNFWIQPRIYHLKTLYFVLVFDGGTMGKMAKNSPYSGMVMVQYGAIWWPQDPKLWN
jgi:hypothetical protein